MYYILHPLSRALTALAMALRNDWLFDLSGALELFADEIA